MGRVGAYIINLIYKTINIKHNYTLQWHGLMTIEDELEDDILMAQREEMIEYDDGGQIDRTTAK